jgi:hypothetical protein
LGIADSLFFFLLPEFPPLGGVDFFLLPSAIKQLKTQFLQETGFLKSIPKSDFLSRTSGK